MLKKLNTVLISVQLVLVSFVDFVHLSHRFRTPWPSLPNSGVLKGGGFEETQVFSGKSGGLEERTGGIGGGFRYDPTKRLNAPGIFGRAYAFVNGLSEQAAPLTTGLLGNCALSAK